MRPALGFIWAAVMLVLLTSPRIRAQSVDTFNPNVSSWVTALAVQADGKVLFGGDFLSVTNLTRNRIARVLANGNTESTFNPGANDTVYAIALQPDGRILVGGDFTALAGTTRYSIGRLNSTGTLDTSFRVALLEPPPFTTLAASVKAIVVQPDGKLLIGGWRSFNSGPQAGFVARLNANGTSDNSFPTPVVGFSAGTVHSLALQPDGKIVVAGNFSSVASQNRKCLARLNPDGTVDSAFNPDLTAATLADGLVALAVAVQADGRILVGGAFTGIAGQTRTNLARLQPDGTLDPSFEARFSGNPYGVYSLVLQADGKIIVGGIFSCPGDVPHRNVVRLAANGEVDESFTATAASAVYALALQADGRLLVGGLFNSLGSQARNNLGRVTASLPPAESLTCAGSAITWLRSGSAPEVIRTTFETSTNGSDWELSGEGTRTPGGWERLDDASSVSHWKPGAWIRARGFTVGGGYNGSGGMVESLGRIVPQILPTGLRFDGIPSFHLHLTAVANAAVVVEASTNLLDWLPIETNRVDAAGDGLFQDTNNLVCPNRFFRARFQ